MKIALGFYTELSESSPVPVFDRALSLVYEPLLSFIYNNQDVKNIFLYQSSQMCHYIRIVRPEYRVLLSNLAKRGALNILTGVKSQSILSIIPPKERVNQLEKMTNIIKRDYGVLSNTAFFYGQIWSPTYISALKTCAIDQIIISTYKATNKEIIEHESFTMNELGKRIKVYVTSDEVSSVISSYQQGEINIDQVEEQIEKIINEYLGSELIMSINIDQLLQGASRSGEGAKIVPFIERLCKRVKENIISLDEITSNEPGYLDSAWYGRDAYALGLRSFNDIFVRNSNYRYLLNRYTSLFETPLRSRELKKDIAKVLFNIESGPLFIYDAQCSPLRIEERRLFWNYIIEAENLIWDDTGSSSYREYDLEEYGINTLFLTNKDFLALVSPLGGALTEFDYRKGRLNLFDTRTPFDKNFMLGKVKKSFSESITLNEKQYITEERIFDYEFSNSKHTDVEFILNNESLPFSIIKNFKLRNSTFLYEITLINNTKEDLNGTLEVYVYLDNNDILLSSSDQRSAILQDKLVEAKTVRYTLKDQNLALSFSSTKNYKLSEKSESQSQFTSLGLEDFVIFKKLTFSFNVNLGVDDRESYRLVLRLAEKEKEKE